jgi:hypothetical protein
LVGNVDLYDIIGTDKNKMPADLKFNKVTGNFSCKYIFFKDLEFCPYQIDGDFGLTLYNELDFKGFPKKIGRNIYSNNGNMYFNRDIPFNNRKDEYKIDINSNDNFLKYMCEDLNIEELIN